MKYLIIVIVLAGLGFAAFQLEWTASLDDASAAPSEEALFTVKKDVLKITVKEQGFLKAKKAMKISPKFRHGGVISWLIEEGTEVKKDDILVEFEKTDIQKEIDDLENRLLEAETELTSSETNKDIQVRENEASIESAQLSLTMKEMELDRYLKGDAPNELRKLKIAITRAESDYNRAKQLAEEAPKLYEEGFYNKLQMENELIAMEEKKISLENCKKELELFNTYTFKMTESQKKADIKNAERALVNAKEKAKINLGEKESRVSRQKRQVKSLKTRLEKQKKELAAMTMKAPQPGIVHYGDTEHHWMPDEIKVGGRVWSGMTVITLPNLTEMQEVIHVHEADIGLVKEGQKVDINVETAKGKAFKGEVVKIASVASPDRMDKSNKTFKVTIDMESNGEKFLSGITATAEIHVEEVPDVLLIPIHSVISEGGEHFCFVNTPKGPAKRVVKIGKNNAHYVQVLEGVIEGEQVLLYDPRDMGNVGTKSQESDAPEESGPTTVQAGKKE